MRQLFTGHIGGAAPVDALLRLLPSRPATSPRWLRVIDPIAFRPVEGVHPSGTAVTTTIDEAEQAIR